MPIFGKPRSFPDGGSTKISRTNSMIQTVLLLTLGRWRLIVLGQLLETGTGQVVINILGRLLAAGTGQVVINNSHQN